MSFFTRRKFWMVLFLSSRPDASLVWNFPIDVTFKATNAFGWPQIVLSIYEVVSVRRLLRLSTVLSLTPPVSSLSRIP